jgi:NAD(P)-dependent dehydrogenase (short-subunit alcohol dehydrogenase family)
MVNEKLKSLNENYINQSWQPTVDDYREIAPGEDLMNYSFNYSRMVDGKVTIITGASDGMGFKMAELYAQHGAKVIMIARREEKLNDAAQRIRDKFDYAEVYPYAADIMDPEKTKEVFAWVKEKFGRLDVLVNNAGAGDPCIPDTSDDELIDWYVDLNLKAPMRYTREALKIMLPQNYGHIVNIGSINGTRPLCGSVYSGAKGGLNTWTKSVAIRCVGTNINCTAVCPGFTVTPLSLNQESNATETGAAKKARSVDYLPILHKKSTRNVPTFPIDQAHAALFFGSDLARCITGQIVNVDNGQYL